MKLYNRIISLFLILAIVFSVSPFVHAADSDTAVGDIISDSDSVAAWETYLSAAGADSDSIRSFWSKYDVVFSRVGYGSFGSLALIEQKAQQLQVTSRGFLGQLLEWFSDSISNLITGSDVVAMWDSSLGVYRPFHVRTGLWLVSSMGYFPFFRPSVSVVDNESFGGKWIGSRSCDPNGKVVILTEDVLSNLCLTLNQAGESCTVTTWANKYQVICKDSYFYYCSPDGLPYVARIDNSYAVDVPNNYYTENEGDNIYNTGDTVTNNLIDNSSSTVWFPDGTLNYIDQLVYDESTKTYHVDAHTEYNTTNNTYVSNSFEVNYHIDYTSITYIGSTAEYDEEYQLYYELPDGRSSADLTADELAALNVSMDVIPYVRSADDTSIRALYHFDGDTLDSSYWSYIGHLTWAAGASITYMEANAFNGALYLDETPHDFSIHLPGNLLTGDFTIQFRYYQSATAAPKLDSMIYIDDQLRMVLNGAQFTLSTGSNVPTSIGNWQEICMMRKNGVLYYFVNGVCYGSMDDSTTYANTLRFVFGSEQQTYKYLDELRVLNVAAYEPSGYTPSSVPFDTNLSLVLPDSSIAVADEYWDFNLEGNLFKDFNWVGATMDPSVFWATTNLSTRNFWVYQSISGKVNVDVLFDAVRLTSSADALPSGLLSSSTVNSCSLCFTLGSWNELYSLFTSNTGLVSSLDTTKSYTFSIMLADGSVHSVTAQLNALSYSSPAITVLPNGGAIHIARTADDEDGCFSYVASIIPPPNGSMDVVYVELKEGSTANTGHEFVSGVLIMDSADIDKATLAVRTDLSITGYQIGGVRPSLPFKGLVWALVESGRINSLQIYNGQAWEEVDGRIWTGYRWIPYYAFDVLLLKDMWDVIEADPTLDPIYTQSGFWAWLQGAWSEMIRKLDLIIIALGGDPFADPTKCDHQYESHITVPATCETDGERTYTCALCKHVYKEVIRAPGHVWTVSETVGAGSREYVFVDSLDQCTDPEQLYVLPDGYVYGWIYTEVPSKGSVNLVPLATDTDRKTVFNGVGYVEGKRLSSSGGLSSAANLLATGFIPAAAGDVLRIKGAASGGSTALYVIAYDSTNAKTGYISYFLSSNATVDQHGFSVSNGIVTVPLSADRFGTGFDSVRISSGLTDDLFVTVNEEIILPGELVWDYAFGSTGVQYDKESAGYDILICTNCGATAKDYGNGLEDVVVPPVPEPDEESDWVLIDVLSVAKDGAWSFVTGIVRTAFGGLTDFVSGVGNIGSFFGAYKSDRSNEIFGILEYEGEDIWD